MLLLAGSTPAPVAEMHAAKLMPAHLPAGQLQFPTGCTQPLLSSQKPSAPLSPRYSADYGNGHAARGHYGGVAEPSHLPQPPHFDAYPPPHEPASHQYEPAAPSYQQAPYEPPPPFYHGEETALPPDSRHAAQPRTFNLIVLALLLPVAAQRCSWQRLSSCNPGSTADCERSHIKTEPLFYIEPFTQNLTWSFPCRPPSYADTPLRATQPPPYSYAPTPGPSHAAIATPVPAATPAVYQEAYEPGDWCDLAVHAPRVLLFARV